MERTLNAGILLVDVLVHVELLHHSCKLALIRTECRSLMPRGPTFLREFIVVQILIVELILTFDTFTSHHLLDEVLVKVLFHFISEDAFTKAIVVHEHVSSVGEVLGHFIGKTNQRLWATSPLKDCHGDEDRFGLIFVVLVLVALLDNFVVGLGALIALAFTAAFGNFSFRHAGQIQ